MIEIHARFGQAPHYDLNMLGRAVEHGTRQIVFDCADALREYPNARIICAVLRPRDTTPYPAELTAIGDTRILTLTRTETYLPGLLKLELRAVDGERVLKSALYAGRITESLQGDGDKPGNPLSDALNRLESTIADAQTLADEIRQKLDNGEFVGERGPQGEKGDKGDKGADGAPGKDGSDATVTAQNIEAALGYAPVKDVQVAGSSVLADGVANVPIATKLLNGVMRPDFYGVGVSATGILYVQNTSNINITNRVSSAPLTAYNLDYAVKAAMCDGKGAAWTDAEQKAARERMGVDKAYELIEEITLTEKVTQIIRNAEPDGTAYHFKKMYVNIITPQAEKSGFFYSHFNDILVGVMVGAITSEAHAGGIGQVYAHVAGGFLDGYGVGAQKVNTTSYLRRYVTPYNVPSGISAISSMQILGTVDIPINTNIKIYGVRA